MSNFSPWIRAYSNDLLNWLPAKTLTEVNAGGLSLRTPTSLLWEYTRPHSTAKQPCRVGSFSTLPGPGIFPFFPSSHCIPVIQEVRENNSESTIRWQPMTAQAYSPFHLISLHLMPVGGILPRQSLCPVCTRKNKTKAGARVRRTQQAVAKDLAWLL